LPWPPTMAGGPGLTFVAVACEGRTIAGEVDVVACDVVAVCAELEDEF